MTKKHQVKTPEEQKQEAIDYILNFFWKSEKTNEIDPADFLCFEDKNGNADIVIYRFVNRKCLHYFNQAGMTPYEEIREEKVAKIFFIDIAKEIEWSKPIPVEQQERVNLKRLCDMVGIIYLLGEDADKLIDSVLEIK